MIVLLLTILSTAAQFIDPSKLLVATVLDPSNDEIVRDAFTLLRSLRIKGGTLNQATVVVCITIEKGLFTDNNHIIKQLSNLQVELVFIGQTENPLPKTLNKFTSFKVFDDTRFDYFLWLDADTVIFNDPIPHLSAHKYPGQIKCVPDLYSYMSRYPDLNYTELVWNPSLSAFRMLGDGDKAPHGHCNTGVLLFDRLSLRQFMEAYPTVKENIDNVNKFKRDRFLDSLYFVAIINHIGIEVEIFGFEMNYMALFEVEILEDTIPTIKDHIFIGHFVSNTSMYCYTTTRDKSQKDIAGRCTCAYHNKYIPPNSKIVMEIEKSFLPNEACLVMAGVNPPPTTQHYARNTMLSSKQAPALSDWVLDWPRNGSVIQNYSPDTVHFMLHLARPSEFLTSSSSDVHVQQGEVQVLVSDVTNTTIYCNLSSLYTSQPQDSTLSLSVTFPINQASCVSHSFMTLTVTLTTYLEGSNAQHQIGQSPLTYSRHNVSVTLRLLSLSCTSSGQTAYSHNPLLGHKPLSLESQLHLPSFLNVRPFVHNSGVVLCCDSSRGVHVVVNLIKNWRGSFLWIALSSSPKEFSELINTPVGESSAVPVSDGEMASITVLKALFQDLCAGTTTGLRCIISTHSPDDDLARLMLPLQTAFFYIDVYRDYDSYLRLLHSWYSHIAYSGVMIGSRYVRKLHDARKLRFSLTVRDAVDLFAIEVEQIILATYYEANPELLNPNGLKNIVGVDNWDEYPAWYLVKIRLVR